MSDAKKIIVTNSIRFTISVARTYVFNWHYSCVSVHIYVRTCILVSACYVFKKLCLAVAQSDESKVCTAMLKYGALSKKIWRTLLRYYETPNVPRHWTESPLTLF